MTIDPQSPPPKQPLTIADLRAAQNFPLAIAAGIAAALAGAVAWAVITVSMKMELGIVSVGVGALIGYAIRKTGHGIDQQFGLLGAACAVFGCGIGAVLSALGFFAQARHVPLSGMLDLLHPALIQQVTAAVFKPEDLLFYAIAIYEAYKLSFKYRKRKKG